MDKFQEHVLIVAFFDLTLEGCVNDFVNWCQNFSKTFSWNIIKLP